MVVIKISDDGVRGAETAGSGLRGLIDRVEALDGRRLCVASVAREPAREPDAVNVAFLVAVEEETEVERVFEDLARGRAGRIEVELLGPAAAYDFAGTEQRDG